MSIWDCDKPLDAMMLSHDQIAMLVMKHEKEIQELKRLVTPMMEFKQQMPTKIVGPNLEGILNAAGFYRECVGLTDEELLDAYGWQEKIEKNRFWADTHPILEKARQDMLVGLRKVEAKLKQKNRSL